MTEAVIWRKMAAISDWISCSVFSVGGASAAGVEEAEEFSWPAAEEDGDFLDLEDLVGWKICTCEERLLVKSWSVHMRYEWEGGETTYVKLPALDALAGVLVCDDNDELGDLAADHPLVELGHDFLYVGLDLVIGRDCEPHTMLLFATPYWIYCDLFSYRAC